MSPNILCIPRYTLPAFSGFHPHDHAHNIGALLTSHPEEPNHAVFIPRDQAETSEDFVQILPYVLLVCGADIFIYSRNKKGGEERLHGKLSVGVGGHIEQQDHEEPLMAYLYGTMREIQEETGLEIPLAALQNTVLGLLHDPSTPVGRVHLGVLHALHISVDQMAAVLAHSEESMSDPRFTSIADFIESRNEDASTFGMFDGLEPWSQYALTHLWTLMNKPKPWEDAEALKRLRYLNLAACEVGRASAELLLQSKGPQWRIATENLENAIGGLTCMLGRSVGREFNAENTSRAHVALESQLASTQPS